jgi:hypothetical protein
MRGGEMGASMAIFGRIATADMAALKTHAQVDPRIAGLEAVFAALGGRLYGFDVFLCVSAGWIGHGSVISLGEHAAAGTVRMIV